MIIKVIFTLFLSGIISYIFKMYKLSPNSIFSKTKLEIISKNVMLYGIFYASLSLITIIFISPGYMLDAILNCINIFILIIFIVKCLNETSKVK